MHQDCAQCPMISNDRRDPASLTLDANRKILEIVVAGDSVPQRLQQIIDYAESLRDEWGEWHPDDALRANIARIGGLGL
jgi:hypothetical protein